MKGFLVDSPAGIFLLEKTGKISEKVLFPRNPKDAAASLEDLKKGTTTLELDDFLQRLSTMKLEQLTVDSESVARLARKLPEVPVALDEADETIRKLRTRLPSILVRMKIVESKDTYEEFLRSVSMELAKTAITQASTKRDLYAIQTVRCVEDLDKTLNLLAGRIREWYGLHFPELDRLVEKHDSYIRLVQSLGNRENFTEENLRKLGIPQERASTTAEAAMKSVGAEIAPADIDWLREVCGQVLQFYKLRDTAEAYTDKVMAAVTPNMTGVLGAVLSAKLLSIGGGLDRVSKMPASTLQVLGAEKALFRTLKTGARPPKHGVIFQYAAIHDAPKWLRGRIARAVAGKLAIAARMDAFGGANEGEKMRRALDAKIKDLKEHHSERPRQQPKFAEGKRPGSPEVRRGVLDRPSHRREAPGHRKPRAWDQRLRGR